MGGVDIFTESVMSVVAHALLNRNGFSSTVELTIFNSIYFTLTLTCSYMITGKTPNGVTLAFTIFISIGPSIYLLWMNFRHPDRDSMWYYALYQKDSFLQVLRYCYFVFGLHVVEHGYSGSGIASSFLALFLFFGVGINRKFFAGFAICVAYCTIVHDEDTELYLFNRNWLVWTYMLMAVVIGFVYRRILSRFVCRYALFGLYFLVLLPLLLLLLPLPLLLLLLLLLLLIVCPP